MPRDRLPNKQSRETFAALTKVLDRFGIRERRLDDTSKHPAIAFAIEGENVRFPFAGTSSSRVATRVSCSNLARRLRKMGLQEHTEIEADEVDNMELHDQSHSEQTTIDVTPSEAPTPQEVPQPEIDPFAALEQVEEVPVEAEAHASQPTQDERAWDESAVHFARQDMLYLPRPQNPVVVLKLVRDLVAEAGQHVAFDLNAETVRVLSEKELEAWFSKAPQNASTLRQAVGMAVRKPTTPPPVVKPKPTPKQDIQEDIEEETQPEMTGKRSLYGVGMQLGRVLVVMDAIQRRKRTDKVDAASVRDELDECDHKSISSQIHFARQKRLIDKVGPVPGNNLANYYRLTEAGRATAQKLGNLPFTMAGLRPPNEVMAAE